MAPEGLLTPASSAIAGLLLAGLGVVLSALTVLGALLGASLWPMA